MAFTDRLLDETVAASAATSTKSTLSAELEAANSLEDLFKYILSLHNPGLLAKSGTHDQIIKVWEDLEITSEKGGIVYRKRSMHTLRHGVLPPLLEFNALQFPERVAAGAGAAHGYVICTWEQAAAVYARGKKLVAAVLAK